MITVGIIGCGSIARKRHAAEYKKNPNVRIAGFFDHIEQRAIAMTETFGGIVFKSVPDMLEDPAIDAVSVCSANAFHAELTIDALNHGKHVLCEKPMAVTLKDCEAMLDAAEKNGKHLLIGHNQRLAPAHLKARQILESGELGRVLSFASTFGHKGPEMWSIDKSNSTWFFKKATAAFGSMADLGIHKIDLMRYLIGDEVKSVYANFSTLDKKYPDGSLIDVDDNSIEILTFRNGALGTVTTSWTNYGDENNSTTLYCEKGTLRLYDHPQFALEITFADQTRVHYEISRIQTNEDQQQANSGVIDLFVDSIIQNKKSGLDASEALQSMKVVFACLESAETGRRIEL